MRRRSPAILWLISRPVEGLVVGPAGESDTHLRQLQDAAEPVVLVDRAFPNLSIPTVTSDHEQGAFEATSEFIARGHRHIACLQGCRKTLPNEKRIAGYKRALAQHRISFRTARIDGDSFREQSGYESCGRLIEATPRPTALFAFSSQIAIGALRRLAELRLQVARDVFLITFDDHPLAEFLAPPLTAARQDAAELGRQAAQQLFEQ